MSEYSYQKKNGGSRVAPKPQKRTAQGQKKVTPRQKKREKKIMIVMIVLAVFMVLAASVSVLYARWVQKPELPSGTNPSSPVGGESDAPVTSNDPNGDGVDSEPDYDPVQPKVSGERKSEDYYTIFVFGADESSNLTDTMMIVSYDVTNQKATVMSLPRDTIINASVKGIDTKKLNAVYARNGGGDKGTTALLKEVSELLGFAPDYYVKIDWALVGLMVDAIGGVYFEVPWDMWYSDPYQDLYIDLKEGYQLLDGDQAMQLVRWRKNMDPKTFKILDEHSVGDTGRLDIQHDFLKAVLKQTLQLKNATKVNELAKLFGENVVSNLAVENLFWFASQAIFSGLSVDDVEFITMPFYYGTYPVKSGDSWKMRSFVYPARQNLLSIINESLNPFQDDVTLRELDLAYVNSSGGLSSTTGTLADSSMATQPEEYLQWKKQQENPDAEPDPDEDDPDDPDASTTEPAPEVSGSPSVTPDSNGETTAQPGEESTPAPTEEPGPVESSEPDPDSEMPDWLKPSA